MRGTLFLLASLVMWMTAACARLPGPDAPPLPTPKTAQEDAMTGSPTPSLEISSPAFAPGAMIPVRYTCDGKDESPPLNWRGAPTGVQSFALIMDDPDTPAGTWVHWVIFNMPASATGLPAAIPPRPTLADGSVQGVNSWRRVGYGGPCPPRGQHRYFFKLYALDAPLSLGPSATKADLLRAMEGHILARAELMGVYRRR